MVFGFKREKSADKPEQARGGVMGRLKQRLWRTREGLGRGLAQLFSTRKTVDDELLEEIETLLLSADVGIEATTAIITDLKEGVQRKQVDDPQAVYEALRDDVLALLEPCESPLAIPRGTAPFVILMVGINGSGKTTTIGKLSKRLQNEGYSVMLAAGDTFRAAAVEQLQAWGQRNAIPVVAQAQSADPASVVYDAMQSAEARHIDVLIADTAGRLHTQKNLMEELKKVKRVVGKLDDTAPHEVMLVLDASIGQNAIAQAQQFHEAIGVSGIAVTKLDGTARGGVLLAIAKKMGIPIRYIGVGEDIDDLRPFDAREFVDALFEEQSEPTQS